MLTFSIETAIEALRAVVEDVFTGVPVIHARQNAPRPQADYITIDTGGMAPIGLAHTVVDPDNTDKFIIRQDYTLTVQFQAYGQTARSLINRLEINVSGGNAAVTDRIIADTGMSPLSANNLSDVTQALNTGTERRAAVDITFLVSIGEDDVDLGIIESVTLVGNEYHTVSTKNTDDIQWTSTFTVDP